MLCSSFILIYFTVNSYIVNKARSLWRLSLQKMDITKRGDRGSRKTGDHRSLSHKIEVSAPGKPLGSRGPEVGMVALLLLPHTEQGAEQGVRPNPDNQEVGQGVIVDVRPARLATTNITNWKLKQQEDPVFYQAVKHRKAPKETFREALLKVTDRKAVSAYVKSKDQLIMKNGLLYRQSKLGQTGETVLQFVVPQIHRNAALDGCHREAAHQG